MAEEVEHVTGSLTSLYSTGALSRESADALAEVVPNLGKGLGDATSSRELLLVSILVDDSTSIGRNIDEIRSGHGHLLEALRGEDFDADVRVHVRAMNRGVISPYTALDAAQFLTETNYSGNDLAPVTPLYLASLTMLGSVVVKAQQEEGRGVSTRTFTLIITDGEDNKSGDITADHVHFVTTDMLEFSSNHIIAGMGVGERSTVDFRDIFESMGIPRRWRFTPGSSVGDLRQAFRQVAKSLRLAATSQTEFAQLAPGPPPDDSSE